MLWTLFSCFRQLCFRVGRGANRKKYAAVFLDGFSPFEVGVIEGGFWAVVFSVGAMWASWGTTAVGVGFIEAAEASEAEPVAVDSMFISGVHFLQVGRFGGSGDWG